MLVLNMHKAEHEVLDATAPTGEKIRVLVLIDPATGIQVHAPMGQEAADDLAKSLLGTNLDITSQMPGTPAPTGGRRRG
jgi:urocanate hydratase